MKFNGRCIDSGPQVSPPSFDYLQNFFLKFFQKYCNYNVSKIVTDTS